MPYLRIDIDIAAADVQAVEDHCLALGAVAVTLVDQRDDPVLEPAPGEIRLWPATSLQALFAADAAGAPPDPAPLLATLAALTGLTASSLRARVVEDRVWEREWLRDFRPMQFGARLWIIPGGMAVPVDAAVVVHLDPGLAFGTGTHPTTAMCLRWLDAHVKPGLRVIDYGCGSGILAIAALALGASHAHAFDIDPQALLATDENAARNQLRSRLTIVASALELPQADIVVANILAGPLAALAPDLSALVRPGGSILLAGLLAGQVEELRAAYAPWIAPQVASTQDDWVLLTGQRPANPAQFRP